MISVLLLSTGKRDFSGVEDTWSWVRKLFQRFCHNLDFLNKKFFKLVCFLCCQKSSSCWKWGKSLPCWVGWPVGPALLHHWSLGISVAVRKQLLGIFAPSFEAAAASLCSKPCRWMLRWNCKSANIQRQTDFSLSTCQCRSAGMQGEGELKHSVNLQSQLLEGEV